MSGQRVPGRPPLNGVFAKGEVMGKEARVALLLAGSACLMAVMVEWVISELDSEHHHHEHHHN